MNFNNIFLACTKGNTQRQHNPPGCCANDLTPATPAASWFDCFLMCEKRQREIHDCEYFEFMDNTYSGMAEQKVDETKNKNKIYNHIFSLNFSCC